jgi:hypothetical protein
LFKPDQQMMQTEQITVVKLLCPNNMILSEAYFGEAVYNNKDGGSAVGRRQDIDKIHGYVRPHVLVDGQGLQ